MAQQSPSANVAQNDLCDVNRTSIPCRRCVCSSRHALSKRGISACIPPKSNRKVKIDYDRTLYRQRHKIENMFGRLKDWRRVHTRYDRCAHTFMSAICIAAAVIFWL